MTKSPHPVSSKAAMRNACVALKPFIHRMSDEVYRATNRAYPEDYLKTFDIDSVEWLRYEKLIEMVRKVIVFSKSERPKVLEIGTNLGVFTLAYHFVFPDHLLFTADHPTIAQETIITLFPELIFRGIHPMVADLNSPLPFEERSFDLVLFAAVIEHLPNSPRFQMEEVHRVLKPGGHLILDTPNIGAFEKRFNMLFQSKGPYFEIDHFFFSESPFSGHHREYSLHELRKILRWSKFSLQHSCYFDCTPRRVKNIKTLLAKILTPFFSFLRHEIGLIAQRD